MSQLNKCSKCGGMAQGDMVILCPAKWRVICLYCGEIIYASSMESVIEDWNEVNPYKGE